MTNNKWQQTIDQELGEKIWNDKLSKEIQRKAMLEEEKSLKIPVMIPFISMAILTIAVFLSLSFWPNLQQNDQAAVQSAKFQQVYYSKLPTQQGLVNAQQNLAVIGMTESKDTELLEQLSNAYTKKQEIDIPRLDRSTSVSTILIDEHGVAYPYNIYRTFTDEVIFEEGDTFRYYKYSGDDTSAIFELVNQQFKLKPFLILAAIIIIIEILIPIAVRKYYRVPKRKEVFDNIILNKIVRWAPLPYIVYFNVKLALRPVTLTWWEVLIPFIGFQFIVLFLLKQQNEPYPYRVERMFTFVFALIFIIGVMIML